MSERPLKVLQIAFACEPERASEPAVGWNCAYAASRDKPVWVITDPSHKAKIEAWLQKHGEKNIHVAYHAMPAWTQWMWRIQFTVNLYYTSGTSVRVRWPSACMPSTGSISSTT